MNPFDVLGYKYMCVFNKCKLLNHAIAVCVINLVQLWSFMLVSFDYNSPLGCY
jgi:hypothetical protein